jgi:hypothetical protein
MNGGETRLSVALQPQADHGSCMGRIARFCAFSMLLAGLATPADARDALGVFGSWGAFRDVRPLRCFAIAEPAVRRKGDWRPFASIGVWPGSGVRRQLHLRLRYPRSAEAKVTLSLGDRRIELVGGGVDAWAADPRGDAAIVAAMRSAPTMTVSVRDPQGRDFYDSYELRGAATAIDAAALACARLR